MADVSETAGLLTPAEERELAAQIEVGALAWAERTAPVRASGATIEELRTLERAGREARRRFVQANLGLVTRLVGVHAHRTGLPRDELYQEACLGLLIAIARFDHRRGLRFSTYAVPWIRARIGEVMLRRGGGPSVTAGGMGRLRAARTAEDELRQRLGRDPTPAEVAAAAGLDRHGYEVLLAAQTVASWEGSEPEPGRAAPAPESVAGGPEWRVAELLWHLAPAEQVVVRRRFGLDEAEPMSYAAIARTLDLSASSVRRIEIRALQRLRELCTQQAGRMTA